MRFLTRRKSFGIGLILTLFAASAGAQFIGRTVTVTQLGACNGTRQVAYVTDATNATTLGAGGGTADVWVTCATGSWAIAEVAAVADLAAYLPISATTAAPIVIQNSGAGNDVSVIALDDLFLTPGDALTAAVGGAVAVTTTAGAIGLTAGGTTQDITLTSVDDVILAATDDTTVAGDAFAVATTSATINAAGSTVELTVAAGSVRSGVALGIPAAASLPACDSTIAPAGFTALAWDTTGPDLCACPEGVDWVPVDGSGTCV